MDTRKVTLVATIVVLALLAVGVGYAYTAWTSNSGNTATTEYVELTQSGIGQYTFADGYEVYYDSVNTGTRENGSTGFTYTLAENKDTTTIKDHTIVKLGNSFKLNATQYNGNGGDLICDFTTESIGPIDDFWTFFIKVNNGTDSKYYKAVTDNNATVWKIINPTTGAVSAHESFVMKCSNNVYTPVDVSIYYGYAGTAGKAYPIEATQKIRPDTTVLGGTEIITFSAMHPDVNHVFDVTVSSLVVSTTAPTVTVYKENVEITSGITYKWFDSSGDEVTKFSAAGTYVLKITETATNKVDVFEYQVTES